MKSVDNFHQVSLFDDSLGLVINKQEVISEPTKSQKFVRNVARTKPLPENLPEFRVIRSTRRKRSVSALRQIIPEMIEIVLRREAKNRSSDVMLAKMAEELIERYLPDFHERPS